MSETYATLINCIEGRVQVSVLNYITGNFGVDHVDNITEPGAVIYLDNNAKENVNRVVLHGLKRKIESSISGHNSKIIAIVAHHGCGFVDGGKTKQVQLLKKAKETVESWKHNAETVLLWVNELGEIEEI